MQRWYDQQLKQLTELTQLVRRGDLSDMDRKKIVALITSTQHQQPRFADNSPLPPTCACDRPADVHGRDVVQKLRDSGVNSLTNFTWQQVRGESPTPATLLQLTICAATAIALLLGPGRGRLRDSPGEREIQIRL